MLGMMNGERISVQSDGDIGASGIIANGVRERNDIHALASKNKNSISIMVWNYQDADLPAPASPVRLLISGVDTTKVRVHHYRVDQHFSNSFEKWKALGRPQHVSPEQYEELEQAGHLQLFTSPQWQDASEGKTEVTFDLPMQGVSLIQLVW
jgi:xylan 1,4-beta-xylosidase